MSLALDGQWVTAVRLERLARALPLVPSQHAGGMPAPNASRLLYPRLGGSLDEVFETLLLLERLSLLGNSGERLSRTKTGDQLAKKLKRGEPEDFYLVLFRSGLFAEQIRLLLAEVKERADGLFTASVVASKRRAPQVLGLLSRLPGVEVNRQIVLSRSIVAELESAWNQVPIRPPAPFGKLAPETRLDIGERAELYSMQLERSKFLGASASVLWTSRDDAGAGYDIEVLHESPSRKIEVKGSQGAAPSFYLSSGELKAARTHGDSYEIHFWGDIRLGARADYDFGRLVDAGYPIVISDPATELFTDAWTCEVDRYRVRPPSANVSASI